MPLTQPVSEPVRAVAIGTAGIHILALLRDDSVVSWGYNDQGQLGDGTGLDRPKTVAVKGLISGVVAIAAGASYSLALDVGGKVWAWGENRFGQLGDGTRKKKRSPVAVTGIEPRKFVAIDCGSHTSFALTGDGRVLGWGFNRSGQLATPGPKAVGGAHAEPDFTTPVEVGNLQEIAAIAAGHAFCLALRNDGQILSWGSDRHGSLGRSLERSTYDARALPVTDLPEQIVAIAAGGSHSLALARDGSVWSWGYNSCGQLGNGTTESSMRPVETLGLADVVAIAAGDRHSMALTADGKVYAWGSNLLYASGGQSRDNQLTPSLIEGIQEPLVAISAGGHQSAVITATGAVVGWGAGFKIDDPEDEGGDRVCPEKGQTSRWGRSGRPPSLVAPAFSTPHSFVAQINLRDLPSTEEGWPVPRSGLLSFFYAAENDVTGLDPTDKGGWSVLFFPAGVPLARADYPQSLPSAFRFTEVPLETAVEYSLPPPASEELRGLEFEGEEEQAYASLLEALNRAEPRHRFLGYPDVVQSGEDPRLICHRVYEGRAPLAYNISQDDKARAAEWRLLLQVDSDEAAGMQWGDAGRLFYWIREKDLQDLVFSDTWLLFQSF